ncbi:MAG: dihydroorotate dehydrogenase [Spirochaetes bacterium]|nr:dihydroorotate dehydrogenase [Spirochaetota bacterium]
MHKSSSISFGKIKFPRNGVLGSGILGVTGWSMVKVAQSGAGGVTSKSISKNIRKGHAPPVIQVYKAGIINAVGLSSTGIDNSNKELRIAKENSDAIIIASVFGASPKEFKETIELLDNKSIDAIEINISCPNVEDEFGLPFASSAQSAANIVKILRKSTSLPLIVKLSPNFQNIGEIAKAVECQGADAITAINTVGPGMLIDINTFKPKLTNSSGGLSGPAILPIAIRCVYDIYKNVKIPIIGMGGITSVEDALQMIIAGATLYGVGSGILYEGIDIFKKINNGIEQYLNEKKMQYKDLIGLTHKGTSKNSFFSS